MLVPLETFSGWPQVANPSPLQSLGLLVGIPLLIAVIVILALVGAGLAIWAYFQIRDVIDDFYGVKLSGLMTFFFNVLYFQYHLRRIVKDGVVPRRSASIR